MNEFIEKILLNLLKHYITGDCLKILWQKSVSFKYSMYPRTGLYQNRLTPTASRYIVYRSTPDLATSRVVWAIAS